MEIKEISVYEGLIINSIRKMIWLAGDGGFTAKQNLNGVTVLVNGDSDADLIFRDQQRAQSGYIDGEVGPYPKAKLTAEDEDSDARAAAKYEQRRLAAQAEYEAKAKAKQEAVEAKLANAPGIELSNESAWRQFKDQNQDGYGGAIVTFSERWARLMQAEMSNGNAIEDVADAASHEADLEGITGFMYGCAVSMLAACWKHGDQLRRWHNLKTQIRNEGEKANESGTVLNPAILTIGCPH